MLQRLKNRNGEVVMILMLAAVVTVVGLIEGFSIYKAKPKTIDTIENPAPPEVAYGVNDFK